METAEEIVIVGAGIAGLTTALGLHRLGIRCLVLESWECLRVTGFAFTTWTNAWKALDAIGIGDTLRQNHLKLQGIIASSTISGLPTSQISFEDREKNGDHEVRFLRRKDLLETLAKELPDGTIRFSAKVVSIDNEANYIKLVHLADGSIVKAKVLIGCDGVYSVVAKSLGHCKPSLIGRLDIRGCAEFPDGHTMEPKFLQFSGDGFHAGFIPCNENTIYWFFSFSPSAQYKDDGEKGDPSKLKEFVLQSLGKVPKEVLDIVAQTNLDSITSSQLRSMQPLNLLWPGAIYKENVCVIGDALHSMTPDIGQGGCAALEDGIVLARCLAEVFSTKEKLDEKEEYRRITKCMKRFSEERKWRSFELVTTSYIVGKIQQSSGKIINFFRDKILSPYLTGLLFKRANYDCGKLTAS